MLASYKLLQLTQAASGFAGALDKYMLQALFAAAERSLHRRLQEANAPAKQATAKSGLHRS